jgi:hypothetical protein
MIPLKCDDVAAALTTGGWLRRLRARRHATGCPRCAALCDDLRQITRTLADVPPLTDAHRRLWAAVAVEPPRRRILRPVPIAAALGFGFLVLTALGLWWTWQPKVVKFQVVPVARADDRKPETLRAVEGLRGDVVLLGRELDDLRRRADLLDARREIEALWLRLPPRGNAKGL